MSVDTVGEAGDSATQLDDLDDDLRVQVVTKAAAALADPVRLRILWLLREKGELTVGSLTEAVPVSQPRVSVHLRCLTDCGYTEVRREGRRSFYRLATPEIGGLLDRLTAHAAGSVDGLLACLSCTPDGEPTTDAAGCC
ncbi:helix-turn-helix transcriptional regulator [Haloechinothrix sp. YIM 98757]|uniref:Helix-turn-helix transcriptional regulator n=1 Tax=Haloechinothrix aidingensis TaxID=2752311 RepID=A0A838A3E8_9PSEU|nr:metalloregulator ArsR/SmtB family transcription factor [Haloechinothrix aidingensis]MBA0124060.1 helix-turn-helix transcriptional regulator [Haloechinothrix aidingensis]